MGRDAELDAFDAEARRLGQRRQRDLDSGRPPSPDRFIIAVTALPERQRRRLALGRELARQRIERLPALCSAARSSAPASASATSVGERGARSRRRAPAVPRDARDTCARVVERGEPCFDARELAPDRGRGARDRRAALRPLRRRESWPRRPAQRCRPAPDRVARPAADDARARRAARRAQRRLRSVRPPPSSPPRAGSPHARAAIAPATASAIRRPSRRAPRARHGARPARRVRLDAPRRRAPPRSRRSTASRQARQAAATSRASGSKPPKASSSWRCASGRPSD